MGLKMGRMFLKEHVQVLVVSWRSAGNQSLETGLGTLDSPKNCTGTPGGLCRHSGTAVTQLLLLAGPGAGKGSLRANHCCSCPLGIAGAQGRAQHLHPEQPAQPAEPAAGEPQCRERKREKPGREMSQPGAEPDPAQVSCSSKVLHREFRCCSVTLGSSAPRSAQPCAPARDLAASWQLLSSF